MRQIQLGKNGYKYENPLYFVPIYLFSHLVVDQYLERIVHENHLIDILYGSKNSTDFLLEIENVLAPILKANPKLFGKKFFSDLKTSLGIVYEFHQCWKIDPTNGLEKLIIKTIESMKLPRILKI
jgi:hypothetical protein